MRKKRPEGHVLYWIYVYATDGSYNFDTTPRLEEAKKIFAEMRGEVDVREAFIFYGDKNSAFTDLDPVTSWYAKDKKKAKTEAADKKFNAEVDELATYIAEHGLGGKLQKIYEYGQGAGYDETSAMEEEGKSEEEIQLFIHDWAISKVWMYLVDEKIITPETTERVVDAALSEAKLK
jgi:hypothetical protein